MADVDYLSVIQRNKFAASILQCLSDLFLVSTLPLTDAALCAWVTALVNSRVKGVLGKGW